MRTLIFGGAGMLGRALVAEARSRNFAALALPRGQADVREIGRASCRERVWIPV